MRVLVIDDAVEALVWVERALRQSMPEAAVILWNPERQGRPHADFDWDRYDMLLLGETPYPDEDALMWLSAYHDRPGFPPTIVLAEQAGEDFAVRVIRAGAFDFLRKNEVTPIKLAMALKESLLESKQSAHAPAEHGKPRTLSPELIGEAIGAEIEIPGYRILRRIGEGGMSKVYLASRIYDEQQLVLKVLDPRIRRDPQWRARLEREYRIIQRIRNEHVAVVYDQGFDGEQSFIAMEYFPGGDLQQRIRAGMSSMAALKTLMQIAKALDAVHVLLGFSKITRDLTERRRHEDALRQSEERFRLLVEGVVDYAIYMLDEEGRITSWNTGSQRITGYRREEIVGRHFSRFYLPEDISAGRPWEELAVARRTGRVEDAGWRVRKDGSRFWARVVVTALTDGEGKLRGYAKVTQDLTERRYIEDLERSSKHVNEFVALLAHELRNPLAPIRNAVQVMARMPAGDPVQGTMLQMIERQAAQLSRIVDDVLDVSRITRGVLNLELKPIDMGQVVRDALDTARPAIEARNHQLELDLAAGPLTVQGDAVRLTQLLANLLNNAARYTGSGGKISIAMGIEDGDVRLGVRDNGIGIEASMLERIFDMFVQARPFQHHAGGLGIGLALARRIAELHGGSLRAYSEGDGKGSEFVLRLPLAAHARADDERPAQEIQRSTASPQRVLVVDDNVDAAETLDLLLRSLGHETCTAHNGAEALRRAQEFQPDVVLLDIGMPDIDGYEVARRLRALPKDRPVRIVAVTGWNQDTVRQRGREAGFDLHLVKPVDPEHLARVLELRGGATLH